VHTFFALKFINKKNNLLSLPPLPQWFTLPVSAWAYLVLRMTERGARGYPARRRMSSLAISIISSM
jgi:hypothetical protein